MCKIICPRRVFLKQTFRSGSVINHGHMMIWLKCTVKGVCCISWLFENWSTYILIGLTEDQQSNCLWGATEILSG